MKQNFIRSQASGLPDQINENFTTNYRCPRLPWRTLLFIPAFILAFFFIQARSFAQQANAPCNAEQPTPWTNGTFNGLAVTTGTTGVCTGLLGCGIDNPTNLVDASLTNTTDVRFGTSVGTAHRLRVTDTTTGDVYDAGTYAGFLIESSGINIGALSNIRIITYLNGVGRDTSAANSLVALTLLGSSQSYVGINTTRTFNAIEITFTQGASLLSSTVNVYYPVIRRPCAVATLGCNTPTAITRTGYPAIVVDSRTNFSGVSVGTITTPEAAVDTSKTNFAQVNFTVGVLATANFSVRDVLTVYPAGSYAGFDIGNTTLLGLDLVNNLTILTYLNGVRRDSLAGSSLLSLPSSLLAGTGRQKVGLITTQTFDEVRIRITKAAGLSIGSTNIYSAVFERFCAGPALACNTQTTMASPTYPVFVNSANTGITGVCALCAINNADSVIDGNPTTAATMVFAAGVASTGNLSVKDQITDYAAGTFAGFDIQNSGLLNVNALNNITITTYRDGVQKQVRTGGGSTGLLSVGSSLLTGSSRQVIGFISDSTFDEVKLTINNTVSVTLGNTRVYGAVFQNLCAGSVVCNSSAVLRNPQFPVVIDGSLTGVDNTVCALCAVQNTGNVIDADSSNFASIQVVAGVLTPASIAVRDAKTVYPVGTFAGFNIRSVGNIIQLNLLNSITISTYRNGAFLESRSGSNLINLTLLINIFSTGTGRYNTGFVTTQAFDEIRISVSSLASVINNVEVYGAIVDTRTSAGGNLNCYVLHPDFDAALLNVPISGSVRTNDIVGTGTVYGIASADSVNNPMGATLTVAADGSYTFTNAMEGVYTYYISVCSPGQTSGCPVSPLVITVTNSTIPVNPPIVNADVAMTAAGSSVTVVSLANDACANPGCSLNPASVTVPAAGTPGGPQNGTVSINPANGNITYTPAAGFTGRDSLTYTVCDNQAIPKCGSARQYFTVMPAGTGNTIVVNDDFVTSAKGATVTGNVIVNDVDPDGNTLAVTPQTTAVPGVGTLTLLANGNYTFVPDTGFTGNVGFVINTCDNGSPVACASSTLYILVRTNLSGADITPTIRLIDPNFALGESKNFVVRFTELKSQATTSQIAFNVTVPFGYTLTFNNTLDSITVAVLGKLPVTNTRWTQFPYTNFDSDFQSDPTFVISPATQVNIGFTITRVSAIAGSTANIIVNVYADNDAAYDSNPANNLSNRIITAY
jgi:hypothetical protein